MTLCSADMMATADTINFIAPNGDLTVVVEEIKKRFLVWGRTMCSASPVWNRMLDPNGHFSESSSSFVNFSSGCATHIRHSSTHC